MKFENVAFKTEDRTVLKGRLYLPEQNKAPAIVMTNGFSGVKESLFQYAEAFCEAGMVVLLYDSRGFGESEGPRQHIDPWRQVADYREAITYLEGLPQVDPTRLGMWGTSYAGGHALVLGATDRRLKCVVSQIPFVSGMQAAPRLFPVDRRAALEKLFTEERLRLKEGEEPTMMPVLTDTDDLACLPPKVSKRFMDTSTRDMPEWKNEVTVRSLELMLTYEPWVFARYVAPTPLLMIVARRDNAAFPDLALRAYEEALHPKKVHVHDGGHWSTYYSPYFEETSSVAIDWFKQYLFVAS